MIDLDKLDAYLTSDDAPKNSMSLSDLDGFLTGILCSPDHIPLSEWLPAVYRSREPKVGDIDLHIKVTQDIIGRYNEIASCLKAEPPYIEPIFWKMSLGHVIAIDWCNGFAKAYEMRKGNWRELLQTSEGQYWIAPVFAHLFDDDGLSLSGASESELDQVLADAANKIPEVIPKIFTYWKARSSIQGRSQGFGSELS